MPGRRPDALAKAKPATASGPRTTIAVQGARVHNLKNVSLELPRDRLIVITGLSGSGKSSLAFDTIYAEGQRRYMESLSSYAKRFVAQVAKPDVDFVFGLSPVISIEQKTTGSNPRSTVGTMTDIASYLNLLFATIAEAHCPRTGERVPSRIAEPDSGSDSVAARRRGDRAARAGVPRLRRRARLRLHRGPQEGLPPADHRRQSGGHLRRDRRGRSEGQEHGCGGRPLRGRPASTRRPSRPGIAATLLVGDGLMQVQVLKGADQGRGRALLSRPVQRDAPLRLRRHRARVFHVQQSRERLPDVRRSGRPQDHASRSCWFPTPSAASWAAVSSSEAFKYNPDTWDGRVMYSLSKSVGFSLETPWEKLPETRAQRHPLRPRGRETDARACRPKPRSSARIGRARRSVSAESRAASSATTADTGSAAKRTRGWKQWLDKVMVERTCPDCKGARLRATRLLFTIAGKTIYDVGNLHFDELHAFLGSREARRPRRRRGPAGARRDPRRGWNCCSASASIISTSIAGRARCPGGESQRIRLSTQIGSGLMGMLYVLDEPSIGLHPKDNVKMIATLESLRDIGNTVIVVEHDEDTIRAADHIVEMGPGPGVHGGKVVVQGTIDDVMACKASPTGQFFSGKRWIATPKQRRKGNGKTLTVRGARENNLKNRGRRDSRWACWWRSPARRVRARARSSTRFCTRRCGSGWSIRARCPAITIPSKAPSTCTRWSTSTNRPSAATAARIRRLTSGSTMPSAIFSRARRFRWSAAIKSGRFSFNVKGGRCEECQGEGVISTQLYFMPDVEVTCGVCKGARFSAETLEVTVRGKTISDVLNMSVEEGVAFFADEPVIARKIEVLNDLGLGYLTLGQSATTLSGGEAQRIKIAAELTKLQRSKHTVYILDEPTTGLHLADIERLLECLNRLVDAGHTVLVIEHHLDVIKTADHVIDLGPEGGHAGGEVIAVGAPEEIAACARSYTGKFLKAHLRK